MQVKRSGEFSWLLSQVRPLFRLLLGSYFCVVAAGILVLLDPLIVRFLIDEVIPSRRISWLPFVAGAFFFTYLGRLGFDSLAGILNFRAVQKMTYRSRLTLLRHLQRLPAEYHDNTPPGDTLHRLQMDVDQVATLTGEVIPVLLRTTTIFTLVMITMLIL